MAHALRGVNLGGWLVAERWMTPGLFKGIEGHGEAELVRQLGRKEAMRRLDAHRSTFIQEADIAWLAKRGITLLRVPVGYWLFEETTDFISGEIHLTRLFSWAKRHGMEIIIDLHGLPGSQNGKDHSGVEGKILFYRKINRRATLATLRYIVRQYGEHGSLVGIQVINEPRWSLFGFRLLRYYHQAYRIIADGTPKAVKVIVSDGFRPLWMSYLLAWARFGERLVMDVHLYQAFSQADSQKDEKNYIQMACRVWSNLLLRLSRRVPVMVGEWSAANRLSVKSEAFETKYYRAQRKVFDKHAWAHCYWSYRAPGQGAWDFSKRRDFYGR